MTFSSHISPGGERIASSKWLLADADNYKLIWEKAQNMLKRALFRAKKNKKKKKD